MSQSGQTEKDRHRGKHGRSPSNSGNVCRQAGTAGQFHTRSSAYTPSTCYANVRLKTAVQFRHLLDEHQGGGCSHSPEIQIKDSCPTLRDSEPESPPAVIARLSPRPQWCCFAVGRCGPFLIEFSLCGLACYAFDWDIWEPFD